MMVNGAQTYKWKRDLTNDQSIKPFSSHPMNPSRMKYSSDDEMKIGTLITSEAIPVLGP